MTPPTLTTDEVQTLYEARQVVLEGGGIVTSHTAEYDWNPTLQVYECMAEGLRVTHRAGAAWSHRDSHFVPCHCQWCKERPKARMYVKLYAPPAKKDS